MNTIDRYPPPDEGYFILALFVVCVVVTVKIVRIWLLELSAVFYVFLLRWNVLIRLTKLRD
jgi:hypothetical protein